ncbi:hypothetical protein B296_00012922 [Ensete ventricosum]|uniref:Uncharacterized protein n=1 Tax=Ensete ventricosum TaxID=4639 RepID=A0A427B8S7_ENSVE|nr:hypothetical protein B296_00012922 [Ensete ventricosum]
MTTVEEAITKGWGCTKESVEEAESTEERAPTDNDSVRVAEGVEQQDGGVATGASQEEGRSRWHFGQSQVHGSGRSEDDVVGNSPRLRRELTEGIGSFLEWCKGVRRKKTETRQKIIEGSRKAYQELGRS